MADLPAVEEIIGTDVEMKRIAAGLRADMGATAIAPVFNAFPISASAQNVGMVALTGIKSRFVGAAGGGILVALGLLPVLGPCHEHHPPARPRRWRASCCSVPSRWPASAP